MKLKFGAIVADARGKISGNVFSRNRSGSFARTWRMPVNSNTAAQQLVRAIFGAISQMWRTLTDTQRSEWTQATPDHIGRDSLANDVQLSGFQLFSKLNNSLAQVGLPTVTNYPGRFSIARIGVGIEELEAGNVSLGLQIEGATEVPLGTVLAIYATRGLPVGVTEASPQDYRLITVAPSGTSTLTGYDVTGVYENTFGTVVNGEKVFFAVQQVVQSGERSPRATAGRVAS